jgi:hypothetical protein
MGKGCNFVFFYALLLNVLSNIQFFPMDYSVVFCQSIGLSSGEIPPTQLAFDLPCQQQLEPVEQVHREEESHGRILASVCCNCVRLLFSLD